MDKIQKLKLKYLFMGGAFGYFIAGLILAIIYINFY